MDRPRGGKEYPRSLGDFHAWFGTEADCVDYLEWLRWPTGFVCPVCGQEGGWRLGDGRFECSECSERTSVTAGTIFDRTRTPLTVWLTAIWLFGTAKNGISALSLKRTLGIGSYQTAWAMLHRLRSVLVRPGRERLTGTVEVDETLIGGRDPGVGRGRGKGDKVLTGIAVEIQEPRGYGRCRMAPLVDASAASLHPFVTDHESRAVGSSRTAGRGTAGSVDSTTFTRRVVNVPLGLVGKTRGSCCPAYIASPLSRRGGCSVLTRVRAMRRTCPTTSTSSSSASIGGRPVDEGFCSIACSNSPLATPRSDTRTSSPATGIGGGRRLPPVHAGTRRASSAPQRTVLGERTARATPVKWIAPGHSIPFVRRTGGLAGGPRAPPEPPRSPDRHRPDPRAPLWASPARPARSRAPARTHRSLAPPPTTPPPTWRTWAYARPLTPWVAPAPAASRRSTPGPARGGARGSGPRPPGP